MKSVTICLVLAAILSIAATSQHGKPSATQGNVMQNVEKASVFPIVINTWGFVNATKKAYQVLSEGGNAIDAVVEGCTVCEVEQCDGSVGYGGSPDESSETTLDAMIMDGVSYDIGAVGDLRRVKSAIRVAKYVLQHTKHTMLVGDQATSFAQQMGFEAQNLSTGSSVGQWQQWQSNNCQPNFWVDVVPDSTKSCGPYKPREFTTSFNEHTDHIDYDNHDTIGMVAIDEFHNIAAGTSTNGLTYKIPGRVGDSPIPGAGAYADNEVGGCAATGDGDVMMRFLPCYQAVENMRNGMNPTDAAVHAISRIVKKYPSFKGAIVTLNKNGEYGGATWNWVFQFSVRSSSMPSVEVVTVYPPDESVLVV
mmetsp:Transcript_9551/g.13151  ORF Transcript_9551/g.13151 Transcript_9551/m.13151 type:complete len:364 (+) Transcript_9551:80-1171(+)